MTQLLWVWHHCLSTKGVMLWGLPAKPCPCLLSGGFLQQQRHLLFSVSKPNKKSSGSGNMQLTSTKVARKSENHSFDTRWPCHAKQKQLLYCVWDVLAIYFSSWGRALLAVEVQLSSFAAFLLNISFSLAPATHPLFSLPGPASCLCCSCHSHDSSMAPFQAPALLASAVDNRYGFRCGIQRFQLKFSAPLASI